MEHENFEEYLNTSDSKSVKVLLHLLKIRGEDNILHTTLDDIAKDCGVTKMTVNRVFKRLYETEFLVKIRNSQYKLLRL